MRTAAAFRWACLLLAVLLLGTAFARAAAHLHDLANLHHISGIWMTLAQQLNAGTLYPPLEDDGRYAGTRYMPAVFALVAALARATGDDLLATKLVALLSMAALAGVVFAAVWRATGRRTEAALAAAALLALPHLAPGLFTPHHDAPAVAFSVAGLFVLDRPDRRARHVVLAAALFALALFTKFSAVAGLAAALVVLARGGGWRPAALLAGVTLALVALGLGGLEWASDGRFLGNFRALGSGGMTADSLRLGPARFVIALRGEPVTAAVVALAVAGVALRWRAGTLGLWEGYFLAAAASLVVIFTSPGCDTNHLSELEVAALVVIARALPEHPLARRAALALFIAVGLAGQTEWRDETAVGVDALPAAERMLADDATPAVVQGHRPVVMDAFAFRVLKETGRIDAAPLAGRVRRQEFDAVVLLGDPCGERGLYPHFHFGPEVVEAIREAYRYDRRAGRYYVFVPLSGGEPGRR